MATFTASVLRQNPDYIYPLAVNVLGALVPVWISVTVGKARARTGLKYPLEYHPGVLEEKDDREKWLFNCTQKSHQNLLENLPTFFILFNICSATFPRYGAGLGAMWLFGRVVYHLGYSSKGPGGRHFGGRLTYAPTVGLILGSVYALFLEYTSLP